MEHSYRYILSLLILASALFACKPQGPEKPEPAKPDPEVPEVPSVPDEPVVPDEPEWADEPIDPEAPAPAEVELMAAFEGYFTEESTELFSFSYPKGEDDLRYYPGYPSLSERNTKVLMMRVLPGSGEGEAEGSLASTAGFGHFGSYSIRLRIPDTVKAQSKLGAAVSFFVEGVDPVWGLGRVEVKLYPSDPQLVYLIAETGPESARTLIRRIVNPVTGRTLESKYKSGYSSGKNVEGRIEGGSPEKIADFNASSRFYIYGFDWSTDRIVWWVKTGARAEKSILWDYSPTKYPFTRAICRHGIPQIPGQVKIGFSHSSKQAVYTQSNATEAPKHAFEAEVERVGYEPENNDG